MKWLALVLVALGAHAAPTTQEIAKAAAEEYARGDLDAVRARYSSRMSWERPEDTAKDHRKYFSAAGSFLNTREVSCEPEARDQKCEVVARFEKQDFAIVIQVNPEGRVDLITAIERERILGLFTDFPHWFYDQVLPWSYWLVAAILFHFAPTMHRSMVFGVPMDRSVPMPPEIVATLKRYRRWNTGLALGAAAGMFFVSHAFMPLYIFAMTGFRLQLRRRLQPYRLRAEPVYTAGLTASEPLPKWMWLLCAVPALILIAVTWYLAAHWDELPTRAWQPRTFRNVFGPLFPSWSMLLMFYVYTGLMVWGTRRNPADVRWVRVTVGSTLGLLLAAIVMSGGSALLLQGFDYPVLKSMVPYIILSLVAVIPLWQAMRTLPILDTTPREGLRGLLYVNPSDPAWMVRVGPSFTPNFGHRWIVAVTALLFVQFTAALFYSTL